MVGDNAGEPSPWPDEARPRPGKLLMFPWKQGEWVDAEPNMHLLSYGLQVHNSFGPGMCFGTELLSSGASSSVGLIPIALGGSTLAEDWVPNKLLYNYIVGVTKQAMAKAPAGAVLRGLVFMEGEGSALAKNNRLSTYLSFGWDSDFGRMMLGLRADLAALNPLLPVVLAVQRIAGRDRVFPFIAQVKQRQEGMALANMLRATMEEHEMYLQDFTEMFGPEVGKQAIHFTKTGTCDVGKALAQAYIDGRASLVDQPP